MPHLWELRYEISLGPYDTGTSGLQLQNVNRVVSKLFFSDRQKFSFSRSTSPVKMQMLSNVDERDNVACKKERDRCIQKPL